MNLSGLKFLVTGGAGFIGSHLVDALISEGCYVRVLDDLSNGKRENFARHDGKERFEFVLGSVVDPFDVSRAMEGVDVVFHLATLGVRHSLVHPFLNHRVNAEGTLFLLQQAQILKVKKFIYCSSSEVYGTAEYVPMPETHPTHPCTIYGAGKLAAEAYARAYYKTYGLKTIVVRPFNTFGPHSHHEGDAGEMIPKSIVRCLAGQPILVFGDGSQTRDFTYVVDTARALVEAARCDGLVGGTFNIGSNFEISIRDLAMKIKEYVGDVSVKITFTKDRPGDVLRLYADSSRFSERTGWKSIVPFEEGLVKTIEWFKSRPEGVQSMMRLEKGFNWE